MRITVILHSATRSFGQRFAHFKEEIEWILPSLARFLDGPSPGLAARVVWICRRSDNAVAEFADKIIWIMSRVPWDNAGSCQRMALNRLDEYLVTYSNPRLLSALLEFCETEGLEEEIRNEALRSLGRIVGENYLRTEEIVARIRERLAEEEL